MQKFLLKIIAFKKKLRFQDYVIFLGILLLIGVFLFMRLSRKTQWVHVLVKIQPDQLWWEAHPAPWYTQSLKKNADSYNSFGQKIGTIEKITSFETPDGRNEVIATINLKTTFNPQRHQYEYNYQPILIGKPIEISFGTFSLIGMVTGVNTEMTYIDRHIEARLTAIHSWKIAELTKGLKAIDSEGNILAKISDLTIQNAQTYQITDAQGRQIIIPSEDPTRKDVVMKLVIKTIKYGDSYYTVSGSPVKIGAMFDIEFPSTIISNAEISAIED
jgi:hypothetical protein